VLPALATAAEVWGTCSFQRGCLCPALAAASLFLNLQLFFITSGARGTPWTPSQELFLDTWVRGPMWPYSHSWWVRKARTPGQECPKVQSLMHL
jgi:hypothetical protein